MDLNELAVRWQYAADAVRRFGGEASGVTITEAATEEDVRAVEAAIGVALPPSFRAVLRRGAEMAHFEWSLVASPELPPPPLEGVLAGRLHWALGDIPDCEEIRRDWVSDFPDRANPAHTVWHEKVAVLYPGDGDLIAVDRAPGREGAVVWLSPQRGPLHGVELAPSFPEFVARWTALGCPGPAAEALAPFVHRTRGLDAAGVPAQLWRAWLHVSHLLAPT